MKIGLIISEFESGFASSFKHTSRVQYEVDFDSSRVGSILENLQILKKKLQLGHRKDVKVGWVMTIDHVIMLERLLLLILDEYENVFFIRPVNDKIYSVNSKLRQIDAPNPKEFANDVVRSLFISDDKKQISPSEKLKKQAEEMSLKRALKAIKKNKAQS
jgi:hypothetical protein